VTVPLLALVLGGFGCHTILGIHDGVPMPGDASTSGTGGDGGSEPRGDAAAEAGVSATGGAGGSRIEGSGGKTGIGNGGGGGPGRDAGMSDGGEPDVAPTDGADGGETDGAQNHDGGVDLSPADAAPADASPTDAVPVDAGPMDGKNDVGAVSDAAACTAPWTGSNAPARVFTPSSTGSTACSIPGTAVPTLAAGLDMANFRGAAACGACLRVQAVTGATSVVVPVVERSTATGILLTRAAMDQIAQGADLVNVDWTLVACEVESRPVRYYIKEGTNSTYLGVQVRNSRYPLATVSVVGTSTTIPLSLKTYNYWESTSAGAGPLTLRLTDINGQTFDDPGVKLDPQTEVVGKGQFPICR
jgi:expansin